MTHISIITPSYNYGRFIGTAIQSVLNNSPQASIDCEHVIMDGGSSDETLEVLKRLEDPRLIWRSQPDHGQSDALNKALQLTTGSIVGWLNADDFYLPGALEAVVNAFDEDDKLDVLVGDTLLLDETARLTRVFGSYPASKYVIANRGTTLMSTSLFIRREALGVDPFDTRLRRVMDWDLYLSLRARTDLKFGYLRQPLGTFRFHDGQVSGGIPPHVDGLPPEHKIIFDKHGIDAHRRRLHRPLAVAVHKINKIARGHLLREKRAQRLTGLPMLDNAGNVSRSNFQSVLKVVYRESIS